MHLAGTLMIFAGWLLTALPKRPRVPQPVMAACAALIITAGMVALIQARF